MQFSKQPKTETIQFRVTPEERDFLNDCATQKGLTIAGVIREAIDQWLAAHKPANHKPVAKRATKGAGK